MEDQQAQSEYSKIIVKAWIDPQFKEKLLKNPIQTLKEQGIEIAKGMNIVACENTDKTFYLVLPCKPEGKWTEKELESIAAGWRTEADLDAEIERLREKYRRQN